MTSFSFPSSSTFSFRPCVWLDICSRTRAARSSSPNLRLKSVLNSDQVHHIFLLIRNHNRGTSLNNSGRALSKSSSFMGVIPWHSFSRVKKSSAQTADLPPKEIFQLYTNRLKSWISKTRFSRWPSTLRRSGSLISPLWRSLYLSLKLLRDWLYWRWSSCFFGSWSTSEFRDLESA